jgi:hypothetical protein
VRPVGVAVGVDTQGPGTLTVGSQNINTGNAANMANVAFNGSSTVRGFVGKTGARFLNVSAGTANLDLLAIPSTPRSAAAAREFMHLHTIDSVVSSNIEIDVMGSQPSRVNSTIEITDE